VAVPLGELPRLDAIATGSVAVTPDGRRLGKGHGYSDLEYAILRELGHPPVPVATTVHELQVLEDFPIEPHDLRLALIATPARVIRPGRTRRGPSGIEWSLLSEADLEAMPVLRELRARSGS
jgi:5-formyltetrahydrofolate cyclo-ligase